MSAADWVQIQHADLFANGITAEMEAQLKEQLAQSVLLVERSKRPHEFIPKVRYLKNDVVCELCGHYENWSLHEFPQERIV